MAGSVGEASGRESGTRHLGLADKQDALKLSLVRCRLAAAGACMRWKAVSWRSAGERMRCWASGVAETTARNGFF